MKWVPVEGMPKDKDKCPHPTVTIYELPARSRGYSKPPRPAWMICSLCGYTEKEENGRYNLLDKARTNGNPWQITFDEWLKLSTKGDQ